MKGLGALKSNDTSRKIGWIPNRGDFRGGPGSCADVASSNAADAMECEGAAIRVRGVVRKIRAPQMGTGQCPGCAKSNRAHFRKSSRR